MKGKGGCGPKLCLWIMVWDWNGRYNIIGIMLSNDCLLYTSFTDRDNLFGWLLSFGDRVELTKPQELRRELYELMARLKDIYGE